MNMKWLKNILWIGKILLNSTNLPFLSHKEEFKELETNIEGKRALKQRYLYEYQGNTVEIDVFKDDLRGLILADFEFNNEEFKDKFTPPDFCLVEVTQEKAMAGGRIVGKKYQDIELILSKYGYKPLFLDWFLG